MFDSTRVEKPFKPYPSLQPFCPRAFIYSSKEPVMEDRSFISEIRMTFGNQVHNMIQQGLAKRFYCFGDWIDSSGRAYRHQLRPEGIGPVLYEESKFPIPGLKSNTRPDMLINFDLPEGFSVLEIKSVGECPADRPDRKHYLQANLTAYICGQELVVPDFFILYIERSHPERSRWVRYPVDMELAQLQLELMTGKIPMGICSCAGDWYCPFTEKCFKEGQAKLWVDNPDIAKRLETLKWPVELDRVI